jgi:hypothetical protein
VTEWPPVCDRPDVGQPRRRDVLVGPLGIPADVSARGPDLGEAIRVAIQDVIQRANAVQVDAFPRGDPTPLRDTATDAHYAQLV